MEAQDYLPLTETSFFILLSLATTPKHGYAIIKEVEANQRWQGCPGCWHLIHRAAAHAGGWLDRAPGR